MSAPNSITVKANDLIAAALKEIGVLSAGEKPAPEDSADTLLKLQRLIDQLNAKRTMIFNVSFQEFTIVPNVQPITIGPGAQFDTPQRPVEIVSASLVLNAGTPSQVEIPVNVRDDAWWANVRVKNLSSTLPTDLYYSPDWANGSIYLWPIPTEVNGLRLEVRGVLSQMTSFAQNVSLPPGYWDMIVYMLAVSLCPMFQRTASQELLRMRSEAMRAVMSNNIASPRGRVGDAGMPGVGSRGDFNYLSGGPN